MKKLIFITAAVLTAVLSVSLACSRAPAPAPSEMTVPGPAPVTRPGATPVPAPAPPPLVSADKGLPSSSAGGSGVAAPSITQDRMILRNGDMSLVVKDVVKARDDIAALAARLEGYVVTSSVSGKEQGLRGNIAIRVPDGKFDQAISEIRGLGVRVNSERTSTQDVTEEYVDLQARLKNAQATESQYLAVLQKADKVEDILRVYQQLSQVRQQIEQIKGRVQYLERLAAMSLISVSLEPESTGAPLVPTTWSFIETIKSAIRGLTTFGQWLVTALVWVAFFIPLWGTIGGIIWWRLRKRKAAR